MQNKEMSERGRNQIEILYDYTSLNRFVESNTDSSFSFNRDCKLIFSFSKDAKEIRNF